MAVPTPAPHAPAVPVAANQGVVGERIEGDARIPIHGFRGHGEGGHVVSLVKHHAQRRVPAPAVYTLHRVVKGAINSHAELCGLAVIRTAYVLPTRHTFPSLEIYHTQKHKASPACLQCGTFQCLRAHSQHTQ